MVLTDGDYSLRGRGERFDLQARVSAGYLYDLLPDGAGNQTRVSVAYADLNDRRSGINARLGRQSKHNGGVLGTFDGLFLGWRATPSVRLNLMRQFLGLGRRTRDQPVPDRPDLRWCVRQAGGGQRIAVVPAR